VSDLAAIIDRTPVKTVQEAFTRLQEIEAALPPADGIACFNKLYLAVTDHFVAAERQGTLADSAFLHALDVAFANLYFVALRAFCVGAPPPRAWAPLFHARDRADIAPLQFALAGMNAHINRDLPEALVQTFDALGLEMARPSPQAGEFDQVNEVLASVEADMRDSYFTPLMRELHRDFDGLDDLVANWSVREARATAWTNGAALWHLRAHPTLAAEYLEALDGMVGFAGRGLLIAL
jgi:hypothetical protein